MSTNKSKENRTEQIIEKLKDIQNKITEFEKNYDSKYEHLEKRNRINQELDVKTDELLAMQGNKILVEIGTEVFATSSNLIKNCKFDNVLADELSNGGNKVFFEIPEEYFKRVLFIMRSKPKESDGKVVIVYIKEKMNEDLFKAILKKFFKGEEILKEIKIVKEVKTTGNMMDFLYKKDADIPVVVPVNNNYNYNNNNYNNANYNYNGY